MNEKQLSLNNGEESINVTSSEMIKKQEIENTPFTYVQESEKLGFISLGLHMLTEKKFNNIDEAKKYVKKNMWEMVLSLSIACANIIINDKK